MFLQSGGPFFSPSSVKLLVRHSLTDLFYESVLLSDCPEAGYYRRNFAPYRAKTEEKLP